MYTLDELGSLYEACIDGDLTKVFEYVDEDPEIINVPLNDFGYTILHVAVEEEKAEIVKELIKRSHVQINAKNENGDTPLHLAALYGNTQFVRLLVQNGANVNARNKSQQSPWDVTCTFEGSDQNQFAKIRELVYSAENAAGITAEPLPQKQPEPPKPISITPVDKVHNENPTQASSPSKVEKNEKPTLPITNDHLKISQEALKQPPHTTTQQKPEITVDPEIHNALKRGSKPWNRSKIMIVGEGRAGKTALANSIIGKTFSETESTIGISQFTCDVKMASLGSNGSWGNYKKPEKELEVALAKMILESRNKPIKSKDSPGSGMPQKSATSKPHLPSANHSEPSNSSNQAHPTVVDSKAVADENREETAAIDQDKLLDEIAKTEKKEIAANDVDQELIMKCLADQINVADSKFIISLFDFGGQPVFNVIHPFFLTRYGVYAVVFNMEWLTSVGPNGSNNNKQREECLAYLNFWINSIVIHTYNIAKKETAPIIFIGTRKDRIINPKDHQEISLILFEKFKNSTAWPFVVSNSYGQGENGRTTLWFFPIDNTLGRNDLTMQHLMNIFEETIDQSDYVHQERPLIWLQTMDKLRNLGKSYIHYTDVVEIAKSCDVTETSVPYLLKFLHEMGVLMWHDDEELKDVIILDPVEYFVKPITLIICKHKPTSGDPTQHLLPIHKQCRKKYYEDWKQMEDTGTISEILLTALLAEYQDHQKRLLHLMIKYGLLVPISFSGGDDDDDDDDDGNNKPQQPDHHHQQQQQQQLKTLYLVPALLPEDLSHNRKAQDLLHSFQAKSIFYFIFTSSNKFTKSSTLTLLDCQENGFLPNGLFEKLICKAVSWCQETVESTSSGSGGTAESSSNSNNGLTIDEFLSYENFLLCKNQAILSFGNQKFRLIHQMEYNAIKVEIEGVNPVAIHERLLSQLEKIIKECMKTLKVFTALILHLPHQPPLQSQSQSQSQAHSQSTAQPQPPPGGVGAGGGLFLSEEQQLLINLNKLQQTSHERTQLNFVTNGNRALLTQKQINEYYHEWISENEFLSHYDLFISYRWGDFDSTLVQYLFDRFVLYNIASDYRAIRVFLDRQRLQEGRDFSRDFVNSLVRSAIIVPVVSSDAMNRMLTHNPNVVDNVLLEWILALECYGEFDRRRTQEGKEHIEETYVRRIYPLMIGPIEFNATTNRYEMKSFFADGRREKLPEIVPTATMQKAKELLSERNLPFSVEMAKNTVKSIVAMMCTFLGIQGWTSFNAMNQSLTSNNNKQQIAKVVKYSVSKILKPLREIVAEQEKYHKLHPVNSPNNNSASAAAAPSILNPINTANNMSNYSITTPSTSHTPGSPFIDFSFASEKESNLSLNARRDRLKAFYGAKSESLNDVIHEILVYFPTDLQNQVKSMKSIKEKTLSLESYTKSHFESHLNRIRNDFDITIPTDEVTKHYLLILDEGIQQLSNDAQIAYKSAQSIHQKLQAILAEL